MSYQVLARKWRPKSFAEMAGQQHVLKALENALDHNRLHHAYLFTGTRGVGKTTLARILARCLNCETGVSSKPCGACSSCLEINEGRFVDLIEIDAASHTGVDDVRELIDNAQYLPSRGRYKVYLIDEVHMLSKSAFNALLKTLEEPPAHVKFLLATTDPQKLPVTILSRCLQFNLKNLEAERIMQHLKQVLSQEMIPFEEKALWQLARAADGSMRDALSLTDQAIGFGNGKVNELEVNQMLGSISREYIEQLLIALKDQQAGSLLNTVAQLAEHNPDYAGALKELLALLHRISIAQAAPGSLPHTHGDAERIEELARQITAEDTHLFYQLGIAGLRDLPLAPDPRAGFEMVLLRMLAFKPQGVPRLPAQKAQPEGNSAKKPEPAHAAPAKASHRHQTQLPVEHITSDNWYQLSNNLTVGGIVQNIAAHCTLDSVNQTTGTLSLHFTLDDKQSSLFNPSHQDRLAAAIGQHLGCTVNVSISIGSVSRETPAQIRQRLQAERLDAARRSFQSDESVKVLLDHFSATIIEPSIKPYHH